MAGRPGRPVRADLEALAPGATLLRAAADRSDVTIREQATCPFLPLPPPWGADILRLHALRMGGRACAVLLGLTAHARACLYLHGFDPALERYSPGSILFEQALEDAVAEGARELDFLRGREPYKYRWGAVDRTTARLSFRPLGGSRRVASGAADSAKS